MDKEEKNYVRCPNCSYVYESTEAKCPNCNTDTVINEEESNQVTFNVLD